MQVASRGCLRSSNHAHAHTVERRTRRRSNDKHSGYSRLRCRGHAREWRRVCTALLETVSVLILCFMAMIPIFSATATWPNGLIIWCELYEPRISWFTSLFICVHSAVLPAFRIVPYEESLHLWCTSQTFLFTEKCVGYLDGCGWKRCAFGTLCEF